MDWVVAAIIVGIGASSPSSGRRFSWTTVIVYVFNRVCGRPDYNAGAFNPLSPVSLTPLAVTC
jgi:hypothetical protein